MSRRTACLSVAAALLLSAGGWAPLQAQSRGEDLRGRDRATPDRRAPAPAARREPQARPGMPDRRSMPRQDIGGRDDRDARGSRNVRDDPGDRIDRNARSRRNDRDWRDERGAGPDHRYYRGENLPREYRVTQYVVEDWRGHRLSAPPRGTHWVQSGGDYLLITIATGLILQLILSD